MVLSEVRNNGIYHVRQLHDGAGDIHRHLENLGFVPGEYREYILSRIEAHRMTHTTVEAVEMAAGNQTVSIKIIC